MEDPADHAIAQLRDAAVEVLDGEAEWQEPRVLDLEAVVEDRYADGCSALCVVGMGHRVDHRLAYGDRREVPALAAMHGADLGPMERVLLDEGDRLLDGPHGE